jgi:nitroimidazol reductase NimA-like FMN-containing flavoprotein (pyridoxamine 5'-phosphate oxidase superfamily)
VVEELDQLSFEECIALLEATSVGRIAFVVDDYPVALPVNYRVVEEGNRLWIVVRTEPGHVIDHAPMRVAFQIDGVDPSRHGGWSVLVRGTMEHIDPDSVQSGRERYDPAPWLEHLDSWLAINPVAISGRRLGTEELEWAFHLRAYL